MHPSMKKPSASNYTGLKLTLAGFLGFFLMYEPAKTASFLPFVQAESFLYGTYAVAYLIIWWAVLRKRSIYWPPPVGRSTFSHIATLLFFYLFSRFFWEPP